MTEKLRWRKKGSEVSTLFPDLQKALDTLNHSILLKKIESWIIRNVCEMVRKLSFQSLPVRRRQCSSVRKLKIGCGAPQGPILGTLLFLIYINDLANVSFSSEAFLFADGTSIIGLRCSDLELARDVARLLKWFQWNKLTLNVNKTVYMKITNKNASSSSLKIDNIVLPPQKSSKYLGVILDSKLCFHSHISELRLKSRRQCGTEILCP